MRAEGMAGYLRNKSMSFNAQEAIDDYRIPLSRFNRENIDDYLYINKKYIESEGFTIEDLTKIPIKKWKYVATEWARACEWHHMSRFFNRVEFYDLWEVLTCIIENYEEILNLKLEKKEKETKHVYALASWKIFEKKGRHWIVYDECEVGVIIDKWFYFSDGKKSVTGNHFNVIEQDSDWMAFRKEMRKELKRQCWAHIPTKKDVDKILKRIKKVSNKKRGK